MTDPNELDQTVDEPSRRGDSLEAGMAAGFGKRTAGPRSTLDDSQRPALLKDAENESAHAIQPSSDAIPVAAEAGDRYRVDGEVARGGMGAVLRGRDVDLGRDLAIKVLLEKYNDRPEVSRRFIEEAQIGGQLQHPGVVPVYDIGHFGETPFFTMKLVKGQTLSAILSDREDPSQDLPRMLEVTLKVAEALAYAHAKGVIHRDLKPANIMVGAFGEVQLMDWGLAKVLNEGGIADEERADREHQADERTRIETARSGSNSGQGSHTEVGSLLGTPAYMPPEQANGDIHLVDRRADVFGIGALLCEILTGKPPYTGRNYEEVRRKAANGDLAEAWQRLDDSGADGELIAIAQKCLAAEAIDRPKDAQAVSDGLRSYLDGVQNRLRQAELDKVEAQAIAIEEVKRRKLTLALAVAVLLVVTSGAGSWLWIKADRDARLAQVTREVNDSLDKALTFREQAKVVKAGSSSALFVQAREQVQRAMALVENGPADEKLAAKVRAIQAELDDEERDRKLLATLHAARLAQAMPAKGKRRFAQEVAIPLYRDAFEAYGTSIGSGEPADVAAAIRERPQAIQESIIAALDEWDALVGRPELEIVEPDLNWIRAVLDASQPETAWGRRIRHARAEKDVERRKQALVRLADEVDVAEVQVRTLTLLARQLEPAGEVALLNRVRQYHPQDFWVNQNLGKAYGDLQPPNTVEAVRFTTAAAVLQPDSAGVYINVGFELSKNGQFEEAKRQYEKAIQLDPDFALGYNNLSVVLREMGRLDDSIVQARKALQLDPQYPEAYNSLACALLDKPKVDEAIQYYRKGIQLAPEIASLHYNLGRALIQKKLYDEAIVSLRKAIEFDPEDGNNFYVLGNAHRDKGEFDEALAQYRKATRFDKEHVSAHMNIGAILCDRKHDYVGAIDSFKITIKLAPDDPQHHFNLGNAYSGNKQEDEAWRCYSNSIEIDPTFVPGHFNLARMRASQGKVDEAIRLYRKAIQVDPKRSAGHNQLGALLCDEKQDYDAAIVCFRQAIALDSTQGVGHFNLGNALRHKGLFAEAVVNYQKAIELEPDKAGYHNNLSVALSQVGKTDDAIAAMQEVIRLKPNLAKPHDRLGRLLERKQDFDGAVASFQKAVALDATNVEFRSNLALNLNRKGDLRGSIKAYREVIKLDPKNSNAYFNIGSAMKNLHQLDDAITHYRKAVEIQPDFGKAHYWLGVVLLNSNRIREAEASLRKATTLVEFSDAHLNLAVALTRLGRHEDSMVSLKRAIEINPKSAVAHRNLGSAYTRLNKWSESVPSLKQAIKLNPKDPLTHGLLADSLFYSGSFAEARQAGQQALKLFQGESSVRNYVSEQMKKYERYADVERRLPELLKGDLKSNTTDENLEYAAVSQLTKKHAAAIRFFKAAFAADPKVVEDIQQFHRYNAACCAMVLSDNADSGLTDVERTQMRTQAIEWLQADLKLRTKQVESGDAAVSSVVLYWINVVQNDSDWASIRDKKSLLELPDAQRKAGEKIWKDVVALKEKAAKAKSK